MKKMIIAEVPAADGPGERQERGDAGGRAVCGGVQPDDWRAASWRLQRDTRMPVHGAADVGLGLWGRACHGARRRVSWPLASVLGGSCCLLAT